VRKMPAGSGSKKIFSPMSIYGRFVRLWDERRPSLFTMELVIKVSPRGNNPMMAVHNIHHDEFRESMAVAILEVLAHLAEVQRNIFIWSHYCGYRSRQIAESLGCSLSEVEATLDMINSILYQRARAALLAGNPSRFLQEDSAGIPAVANQSAIK